MQCKCRILNNKTYTDYNRAAGIAYVDPYQDPYKYKCSTSEVFNIHPEYVSNLLTGITIDTIIIYIYSPLNIYW